LREGPQDRGACDEFKRAALRREPQHGREPRTERQDARGEEYDLLRRQQTERDQTAGPLSAALGEAWRRGPTTSLSSARAGLPAGSRPSTWRRAMARMRACAGRLRGAAGPSWRLSARRLARAKALRLSSRTLLIPPRFSQWRKRRVR